VVKLVELVQLVAASHLTTMPSMRLCDSPAAEASLALAELAEADPTKMPTSLAEAAPTTKVPTSSAFQQDELPWNFPRIAVRASGAFWTLLC
jgi:hypothetical protein